MTLSPRDRATVLDLAAEKLVAALRAESDLDELITLPLDAAAAFLGMSPANVARTMETRAMGKRKRGISLKTLKQQLNP